jgi:hypothetical protein
MQVYRVRTLMVSPIPQIFHGWLALLLTRKMHRDQSAIPSSTRHWSLRLFMKQHS